MLLLYFYRENSAYPIKYKAALRRPGLSRTFRHETFAKIHFFFKYNKKNMNHYRKSIEKLMSEGYTLL